MRGRGKEGRKGEGKEAREGGREERIWGVGRCKMLQPLWKIVWKKKKKKY